MRWLPINGRQPGAQTQCDDKSSADSNWRLFAVTSMRRSSWCPTTPNHAAHTGCPSFERNGSGPDRQSESTSALAKIMRRAMQSSKNNRHKECITGNWWMFSAFNVLPLGRRKGDIATNGRSFNVPQIQGQPILLSCLCDAYHDCEIRQSFNQSVSQSVRQSVRQAQVSL